MTGNETENLNILLDMAKTKHESILANIRSLDIKASIILAFFGVLLIPAFEIFRWKISWPGFLYLKYSPIAIISAGIIASIFELLPQKLYTYPQLAVLRNGYNSGAQPDAVKAELISYFELSCSKNRDIALKKLKCIKLAGIVLAISIFVTIAYILLKGVFDA